MRRINDKLERKKKGKVYDWRRLGRRIWKCKRKW